MWRGIQTLVLVAAALHAISLIIAVLADEWEVWRWPLLQALIIEPGWGIPIYRVILLFGLPCAFLLVVAVLGYRLAARRWLAAEYRLMFPLSVLGLQTVAGFLALWAF